MSPHLKTFLSTALCLAALALAGCGDENAGGEGADIDDFPETEVPEAEDIDLAGSLGQTVTVTARVGDDPLKHAFGLGGGAFGEDEVLVVGRELPTVSAGDLVEVTGTVREYALEELETEIGADLDEEALDGGYDHAIVATEVDVVLPAGAAGEER